MARMDHFECELNKAIIKWFLPISFVMKPYLFSIINLEINKTRFALVLTKLNHLNVYKQQCCITLQFVTVLGDVII